VTASQCILSTPFASNIDTAVGADIRPFVLRLERALKTYTLSDRRNMPARGANPLESDDENEGFGQHDVELMCPVGSAMGILGDGPKVIKATLNADGSVTVEHDGGAYAGGTDGKTE
jgi:hypothetical protein